MQPVALYTLLSISANVAHNGRTFGPAEGEGSNLKKWLTCPSGEVESKAKKKCRLQVGLNLSRNWQKKKGRKR